MQNVFACDDCSDFEIGGLFENNAIGRLIEITQERNRTQNPAAWFLQLRVAYTATLPKRQGRLGNEVGQMRLARWVIHTELVDGLADQQHVILKHLVRK
jgi:hypothetical protein